MLTTIARLDRAITFFKDVSSPYKYLRRYCKKENDMSEVSSDFEVNELPKLQQEPPNLGVQDIVALLNIVDIASRRGAFRGEELSSVGAVFDKVTAFLKASGAIKEPTADTGSADASQDQPEETEQ
jgi:hypothetical protein